MNQFLVADNLCKIYSDIKEVSAIQNINLKIQQEEFISILGPSGCGKTTLLRIVAGLIKPSNGSIVIEDTDPISFRNQSGTGFVFQKPVLFPWKNILNNTLLPLEIEKRSDKRLALDIATQQLKKLGLDEFIAAFPSQLSGGMLQRAAVARALMLNPKLLLLDEPFSSLDEFTREKLWFDFYNIWRKQKLTVILVTHSIREAVFFGDRVIVLTERPGTIKKTLKIKAETSNREKFLDSKNFALLYQKVRKVVA